MNQIKLEDIEFTHYKEFSEISQICGMIDQELSEPYSIYTYRYFLYGWPDLCIYAKYGDKIIGVIIGKLELNLKNKRNRGYIAMIVVEKEYRKLKIGKLLAQKFINRIKEKGSLVKYIFNQGGEEIVLETEQTNKAALALYASLGFVRVKRMQNYYMSGNDAFRLKLWFVDPEDQQKKNE